MPIPPSRPGVDRSLLRDDVFRRLRDAIVDGTFQPGEQLKDAELAEWFGVSRTPIREALLRLASSGLVLATPGRSTVVTEIDAKAARDARDVIAAMHAMVMRAVAGTLGDARLQDMRECNRRFAKAVAFGDATAALDADDALHAIPVRALGNAAVESVLEHFDPLVRRAERSRFSSEGSASVARHDRLIDLLERGDGGGAAEVAAELWGSLATHD